MENGERGESKGIVKTARRIFSHDVSKTTTTISENILHKFSLDKTRHEFIFSLGTYAIHMPNALDIWDVMYVWS